MKPLQRVIALLALSALAVAPSANGETRSSGRTELERLAAELERVLGPGAAVVSQPRIDSLPPLPLPSRSAILLRHEGEEVILRAMNHERAARGLAPLRLNPQLTEAAVDRIGDMFAKRYFAHIAPDGIEPFVWAAQRGYRYRAIGENLAVGYRGIEVVEGWMGSAGHRDNILKRTFDEVGIAVADGAPQRGYKGPTVVAMYGAR